MSALIAAAPHTAPGGTVPQPAISVLAYVHLRNIHASTGAGRVARQLVEHLALRDDLHLEILADREDYARVLPLIGGASPELSPWNGFRYHLFSAGTSRQQTRWLAFDRPRAESFRDDAQILFCTGESYVPTRTARSVVTLHDAAYFERDAHRRDLAFWKQQAKWRVLYAKLSRNVDLFHTVSAFSAERLAHFFPAIRSRLRVVPNAVSPQFFAPSTTAGLAYLQAQTEGRPYVLIPGGLHYRKNAELVLRAARALLQAFPDLLLAVVNHSAPEYARQAAAISPRFRELGFVPEEALRALYERAAAVWFPSRYEGFGMPVLEAMACGAPVVASQAASLPEVAGDAALLADPAQPQAHVEALEILLRDESLASQMRRRGLARARTFTWARSADAMASLFHSLL